MRNSFCAVRSFALKLKGIHRIGILGALVKFLWTIPSRPLPRSWISLSEEGPGPRKGVKTVFLPCFRCKQAQNHRNIALFIQPVVELPVDGNLLCSKLGNWKHAKNHRQHRNIESFLADLIMDAQFLYTWKGMLQADQFHRCSSNGLEEIREPQRLSNIRFPHGFRWKKGVTPS